MTGKEAYYILVKYSGGEDGIVKIRNMIHLAGVEEAARIIIEEYENKFGVIPEDFKAWIIKAYTYIDNQIKQNLN